MSNKKNIIIYGASHFSKILKFYIDTDTNWNVVGFCDDNEQLLDSSFCGLHVYSYADLIKLNLDFEILIGIGYSKMNSVREKVYKRCKSDGYKITSYIHSSSITNNSILGEGIVILENCIIGPFSKLCVNNLIWNNCNIGHDNEIGNFNMIAGSSSTCGFVRINNNCFIGNSSVIKEYVNIESNTLIGANCFINKNTKKGEVYKCKNTIVIEKKGDDYY